MKTFNTLLGMILVVALVGPVGCGGGASTTMTVPAEQNVAPQPERVFEPECYTLPVDDPDHIYGKGTAKSVDRQMSVDQADLIAAADIAANLERWVQEREFMRQEDFQKFTAIEDSLNTGAMGERNYENTRKAIVSKVVKGTEEYCNELYTEGNQMRCYRVLRLGVGKANKALYDEIMQNETLMRMYKDSEALKKLKEDVEAFEAKKAKG